MRAERMIAFTDAVLAIIMTILVLGLDLPDELSFAGLWEMRAAFFAYCLSFIWIGSMWISLNSIWRHVKKVNGLIVWWNLIFLFFASFMPYATELVSFNFNSSMPQAFYGFIVIMTSICNWVLHKLIEAPNAEENILLKRTKEYRTILLPDIIIKIIALILSLTVYPPAMMYGVLAAAGYLQIAKAITTRLRIKHHSEFPEE